MRSVLVLGLLAGAHAFAPSGVTSGMRMPLKAASAARKVAAVPRMSLDVNSVAEGAQALIAAVPNVPFVDEITGEPQGFTAPLNHFASVISLWALFALPVWSAAYKQAGCDTSEWFGASHVTESTPGLGLAAKYSPDYDGPSFREGIEYVISFGWKPPILVAWKPRADLDRATMDPARETVVSGLYKGLGGALDKSAVYDEEDQLLILSDIEKFPETELGKRREKIAEANGWFTGNPAFGKSLIEFSEETKKGKKEPGTVSISAAELKALRAEAAKKK